MRTKSPASTASRRSPRPPREAYKRLSPTERRNQIIEVAEELFTTRPYAELGVLDVAKAAGITQGLIYHYFASKEALFVAAFEQRASELLERCLPNIELPVLEQVERGVRGYLDFVEDHGVSYLNLFRGPTAAEPDFLRICDQTRQAIVEHFTRALGVSHLALPASRLALRGYVGFVEAAVLSWLPTRDVPRETLERLIFAVIGTALLTGLASDGVEPSSLCSLAAFETLFRDHFLLRLPQPSPPAPRSTRTTEDASKLTAAPGAANRIHR